MTRDPSLYTFWLISRAAGVTAYALASASVIYGLSMAAKLSRRPGGARRWRSLHEHLAIGTLVAVVVHGVALLGDKWLHPSVAGILVPGSISYRPLAVAGGIVAAYGMATLGLTFYARRKLGAKRWRTAHRFTIVFWAMAGVHALTAGTDATTPWMRAILGGSAAAIAILFAGRMLGGGRKPQRAAVPPRTRRPAASAALEVSR